MRALELNELPIHGVVRIVVDGRSVEHVITVIVLAQLFDELDVSVLSRHEASIG
jgi:hypothetical protein